MARIIENKWTCDSCQTVNRGRDMRCKSCGNPKEAGEKYVIPNSSSAPTVVDPELLKMAAAAPHWECEYCGSQERALHGGCASCGAGRPEEPKQGPGKRPPRTARRRSRPRQEAYVPRGIPTYQRGWSWGVIAAGAAGIAALILLLLWLFMPHEESVQVAEISWEYTEHLKERVEKDGEGWDFQVPAGAHNVSCINKFYGTEDCNPYDCNPHEVGYDCNPYDCGCREVCTDLGNGFSSCDDVCSTCYEECSRTEYDTCYEQCDVYKDWCDYSYYEWPIIRTEKTTGSSHAVEWYGLKTTRPHQKIVRIEEYQVSFSGEGKIWAYQPSDLGEFRAFEKGAEWIIKVNRAGQVWPQHEQN